jgi:3-hydroxyacyl-[acyl-carrier-protein] dehydratase
MAKPLMSYEEVKLLLKQRFPIMMIDNIISLEPGKSIQAVKNVTGNEIHFLGHFPEYAVMPGCLIMEAISQAASILFSKTTGAGVDSGELLSIGTLAFVEGTASVDGVVVAKGKLGFGGKRPQEAAEK